MKLFTIKDIRKIIRRRSPLLMLDRAVAGDDGTYTAIKNVTANEPFFAGHFPNHPIVPGVLQVEAMKQLGELAAGEKLDPSGTGDIYIRKAEKVKFRRPNLPGDRLLITAAVEELSAETAVIRAAVRNNGGAASEAILTLGVRPRTAPESMPCGFDEFDRTDSAPMDINRIMSVIPHRFPFLLIDHIALIDGDRVVAVKNISANESCFASEDSDYLAMPESLLCEICAQAGCSCVLARPENAGKLGYFMAIERAESFAPVFPGDRLVVDMVLPPGKSKFGKGACTVTVDGRKVFEIAMMFAIVDA